MTTRVFVFVALLFTSPLLAQNFLGTWQGTLRAGDANLRVVVEIVQPSGSAGPVAHLYSPDQGTEGMHVDVLKLNGNHLHLTVATLGLIYDADLSPDAQTLDGTLTQGSPSPLKLTRSTGAALWIDPHIHGTSSLVTVEPSVQVEVVDWGGSGRMIVLLSGLGNTAHIYDHFAQKLTPSYHVLGITRRGFGDSSVPSTAERGNYTADRLGDDVLAVLSHQHVTKAVLVGHSIAGEELSSVSSRHPEAVSALIYLDAGFSYALYDPSVGDFTLDLLDLQRKVTALLPGSSNPTPAATIAAAQSMLPALQHDFAERAEMIAYMPSPPPSGAGVGGQPLLSPGDAITLGERKYDHIPSPTLAIFAVPHDLRPMIPNDPKALASAESSDLKRMSLIANSFARNVPTAQVVRLSHASHYVFLSNEAAVLKAMESFLADHK